MTTSALIGSLAAVAIVSTAAACSSPGGPATQHETAAWNTHGWIDDAFVPTLTDGSNMLISNSDKGERH